MTVQALEVLVIDNAGCRETQSVVEQFKGQFSSIRSVIEPSAGVAFARNRGRREAGGEVLAYLDDDCLVDPDWLEQIDAFFSRGPGLDNATGLVGGRTLLLFEIERPAWLTEKLLPNFSQIDWGTEIKPLKDVSKWIGEGNMAMRPAVFDAAGGFPVSLGRRKNSLMGHEGNALREKLEKMGYVTWYNGKQKVEHIVFEARITSRGWVRKRAFWGGVSEALCHLHSGEVQRKGRFLFAARYFKLVCSTGVLRLFIGADPDGILLEAQCEALFKLGYSAGLSFFGGRLY